MKMQYARVLIEVDMNHKFPNQLMFFNEYGEHTKAHVSYEWKPELCGKRKIIGHKNVDCRKVNTKKVWVQKQPSKQVVTSKPTSNVVEEMDQEGFHMALKPIRVRVSQAKKTHTRNAFHALAARETGQQTEIGNGAAMEAHDVEMGTLSLSMDKILTWNVRGLNSAKKQKDVHDFIHKFVVGLVGLMENKVKVTNLDNLYQRVFADWCFTSYSSYHAGGRIVLACNPSSFTVNIIAASSQFLHCHVSPSSGMPSFYCTFIYAFNDPNTKKELWRGLRIMFTQDPWILCGDYNCVMYVDERIGAIVRQSEMADIVDCMNECHMVDIKCIKNLNTWNNKQRSSGRVFSKLDRVLANPTWQSLYESAEVCFMTEGEFDR